MLIKRNTAASKDGPDYFRFDLLFVLFINMRGLLTHILALLCLLSLLAVALAADDPDYIASQSYRPKNVTGLTWMYPWVGSSVVLPETMMNFLRKDH
jgi:hypothetical protein